LLVGPPGTGKTLLAKAVAGEAHVPFFSISGSDFVEMFVGVGAARVRDLFQQAKEQAPCIIFIDEIDAIGKSRANNAAYGGFDERENTLNQLLVEMDGFDANTGAIIIGATNRPDTLDPALLRPGRFDRQVVVDKPDMKGRQAIFKVHTNKLLLSKDVQLDRLAAQTPGFAGAEIANVCNEAAIYAVRNNRTEITMADFEAAIEKVIAGLEKKNKLINEKERKIVAYHEAGHAIVGYFTPGADEVQKVSIVPRGIGALGYTLQMPLEDRYLMTRNELLGKIKGLLGGRAAEEIIFNEVSTGASNDLERVAQLARSMVMMYGMSEKLPNYSLAQRHDANFLGQEARTYRRSEKVEQLIDEEIQHIINSCYDETKQLLINKKDLLEKMAYKLLEKEVLNHHEIKELLGQKNNAELKDLQNLQLMNYR
jgi:cell division protease FtsH